MSATSSCIKEDMEHVSENKYSPTREQIAHKTS